MAKRSIKRGFTLIELVIVIAVIAILAALLAPTILGQVERSRSARARQDVHELANQIARMRVDTGTTVVTCLSSPAVFGSIQTSAMPPSACTTLTLSACNYNNPDGAPCWGGPYMPTITNDPWGNPYAASADSVTFAVTITSNGPDGKLGTGDDLTAIQ